jgi:hypothetical protein
MPSERSVAHIAMIRHFDGQARHREAHKDDGAPRIRYRGRPTGAAGLRDGATQ